MKYLAWFLVNAGFSVVNALYGFSSIVEGDVSWGFLSSAVSGFCAGFALLAGMLVFSEAGP